MRLIIKMVFGSHLYGTDGASSDKDYKAVYLPDIKDVILQRVRRNIKESTKAGSEEKNKPSDVETEIFSIHEFIKLACEGQTVALDMLHAPEEFWCLPENAQNHGWPLQAPEKSWPIWHRIVKERHRFYTKNLQAFVGYARKQAAKYGIKGSRLSDLTDAIEYLRQFKDKEQRLEALWDNLIDGEHIRFVEIDAGRQMGMQEFWEVLGRRLGKKVTIKYALNCLKSIEHQYGERARMAQKSEGVDWKALSHAHRAADQCFEILKHKRLTFPRPNAAFLKAIKDGVYDYPTVAERLETKMEDLGRLQAKSDLPDRVDRTYWDNFILSLYLEMIEGQ